MMRLTPCLLGALALFVGASFARAQSDSFAQLRNLSTRALVDPEAGPIISGFVISGSEPKEILLRAAGPALTSFGVGSPLRNPVLSVFDARGRLVAQNAGWGSGGNTETIRARAGEMGAFPFANGSLDSAVLLNLEPGAYTAHVTSSAQGIALLELYGDRQASPRAHLANMSSRVRVGGEDAVGIVGLMRVNRHRLLIRAIGPSLAKFGVNDFLRDPVLELVQPEWAGGTRLSPVVFPAVRVAKNDGWQKGTEILAPWPRLESVGTPAEIEEAIRLSGAFPLSAGSKDAAMLIVLGETATLTMNLIVSSASGGSGVALIEVYDLGEP